MNTARIVFALSQNALPPIEHLVLIVISDSCDELFTFNQAVAAVTKCTSLSEDDARAAISYLHDIQLLGDVEGGISNPQKYFVMVSHG